MRITTITSRQFNQDVSKAKRASRDGPVFITDRGHPAHVLLSIEEYQKMTKQQETIVELLMMPDAGEIEFDPKPLKKSLIKPEDFS